MNQDERCEAKTRKGSRCKRLATIGTLCKQHHQSHANKRIMRDVQQNVTRDERLMRTLTAGTSLIIILEKAMEYLEMIALVQIYSWTAQQALTGVESAKTALEHGNYGELENVLSDPIMVQALDILQHRYPGYKTLANHKKNFLDLAHS
ncbi:MAG: hypothetical protein AB8B81_17835 [Halioglobus sp.]